MQLKKIILFFLVCTLVLTAFPPAFSVSAQHSGGEARPSVDLNIPMELNITRPEKSSFTTTYASYFITGTSNPDEPLYFNGDEVERQGSKGTFGVFVELVKGNNVYTFSQNTAEKTIIITRKTPDEEDQVYINDIADSTMYPKGNKVVNIGETVTLSCVAPATGKVKAVLNGLTIPLKQVAVADDGIPATFKADHVVSGDFPTDETTCIGKVEYILDYKDETSVFSSKGEVFVIGESAKPAMRVDSYLGYVYPNTDDLSVFKELLKENATDYIKTQAGGYFELASGGFIPVNMAEVIVGKADIENKVSAISGYSEPSRDIFKFEGTSTSAYHGELNDNVFTITLFNSSAPDDLAVAPTKLFSGINLRNENNNLIIDFILKNSNDYWGYNVVFDNNKNTYISLQRKPTNLSYIAPLNGINIMIDPGHGGSDPGSLGVAGTTGPSEAEVNLAHAYALEEKLAALGANVYITRTGDDYYSLDNRLRDFADKGCDLFISLHHNSIDYTADANTAKGAESYYHTPASKDITQKVIESVTGNTQRSLRGNYQSYYRVTISHYAPSMLLELGFMPNPYEYEKACDQKEIDRVANAIAIAVVDYLFES